MKPGDFHEEDEPVADVVAAFNAGVKPCEFSTGDVSLESGAPVVTLCGRPGAPRRGVMWCEVYACDECYSHWLNRNEGEL